MHTNCKQVVIFNPSEVTIEIMHDTISGILITNDAHESMFSMASILVCNQSAVVTKIGLDKSQ